jgi:hypothetical protein
MDAGRVKSGQARIVEIAGGDSLVRGAKFPGFTA